jgi:hypothetical protein
MKYGVPEDVERLVELVGADVLRGVLVHAEPGLKPPEPQPSA